MTQSNTRSVSCLSSVDEAEAPEAIIERGDTARVASNVSVTEPAAGSTPRACYALALRAPSGELRA